MMRTMHPRSIICGLVLGCVLGACTTPGPMPVPAGSARASNEGAASRASLVAADLLAADVAYAARDQAMLAATLQRLALRGVHPLDASAPDPLSQWREAVPGDLPPMRGRALGPGYANGMLEPGAAISMDQLFLSGQVATIAVRSTPLVEMHMRIHDATGSVVCDSRPAHARDCRFTPVFTQRYRIELNNDGPSSTRYYVVLD